MAADSLIVYLRVSTARQGRSGLGIEAHREAVARYLQGGNWTILAEHVEVESGRVSARPALDAALAAPACIAFRCSSRRSTGSPARPRSCLVC